MDPFIGQIFLVGFNFAPVGFALCDGSLISIAQNQALFALLGTTYGGNGQTTFGLPDLRGRIPVGLGNGPGLTPIAWGQKAGTENVTLTVNQIPAHTHNTVVTIPATAQNGTSKSPANLVPAVGNDPVAGATINAYGTSDGTTHLAPTGPLPSTPTGGSQPVNIREPYLGMQYIIATQGIFPSRQ